MCYDCFNEPSISLYPLSDAYSLMLGQSCSHPVRSVCTNWPPYIRETCGRLDSDCQMCRTNKQQSPARHRNSWQQAVPEELSVQPPGTAETRSKLEEIPCPTSKRVDGVEWIGNLASCAFHAVEGLINVRS